MWLRRTKSFRARPFSKRLQVAVNTSQSKVPGYSWSNYQRAHVAFAGAGGLGAQAAYDLMRKGAGTIEIWDDDIVEPSNRTRQPYTQADDGRYKAYQIAKRITKDALFPITVKAHPKRWQECHSTDCNPKQPFDLIVCVPDNNPTRLAVTKFAHRQDIPVIHTAVGRDANALYVFVQEPGHACWACSFPSYVNSNSYPCNLPGTMDVLSIAHGLIVYAADSIICSRSRHWNRRDVYLDGSLPDRTRTIQRNPDCPVCGQQDPLPLQQKELAA